MMTGSEIKEKFGRGILGAAVAALIGAAAANLFSILGWGAQHLREADLADSTTAVRLERVENQVGQIAAGAVQQSVQIAALDARLGEINTGIRDMRTDLTRRTEVLLAIRSLSEDTRTLVQAITKQSCSQLQCDRLEEAVHDRRK